MQDLNIDLGKKSDAGIAVPESLKSDAPEKYYPCIYLDDVDAEDLPDEGQMLISYRLKRETTTKDDKGKKTSVDIEVRSIDGVEASEVDGDDDKKTPSDEFESRMKKHLKEKTPRLDEETRMSASASI